MPQDELPPSFVDFRRRVFTSASNLVESVTTPIVFAKDNLSTFDRTGILFSIADFHFLITAEHDLEQIDRAGYTMYVAPTRPCTPMAPIVSKRILVSHDRSIDLAVILLEQDAVDSLSIDYQFLNLNRLRIGAPSTVEGPYFLVLGFPKVLIDQDGQHRSRLNTSRYLTVRYEGTVESIDDFHPESHIVLEYDTASEHTSGYRGAPPDAPGLSGCGIWYLSAPNGIDLWTEEHVQLVGIQTSWHSKERYLKGTIIAHALAMIWGWLSDTRDVMRFHGLEYRNGRMQMI